MSNGLCNHFNNLYITQRGVLRSVQMAKDFGELDALWKARKNDFEPLSITQILCRFSKGPKAIQRFYKTVMAVFELAESRLDQFDIRGVTLLANTARHIIPSENCSIFQNIAARLLKNDGKELQQGKFKDLCMLADAARVFKHQTFLEKTCDLSSRKLRGAKPQELSPIAQAYAKSANAKKLLNSLQKHVRDTKMLEKLTDWQLKDLLEIYEVHTEFSQFYDELMAETFARKTVWQTNDWEKSAKLCRTLAQKNQYAMCRLFFKRLEKELPKLAEHVANFNFWKNILEDETAAEEMVLEKSALQPVDTEKLMLLYIQVSDHPEFFTDEIEYYFAEMGNRRLKNAEDAWEAERML